MHRGRGGQGGGDILGLKRVDYWFFHAGGGRWSIEYVEEGEKKRIRYPRSSEDGWGEEKNFLSKGNKNKKGEIF